MDPVSALGIASGIVQLVHFTSQLASKGYRVGRAVATGEARDNVVALEDIASNLQELTREIIPGPGGDDVAVMRGTRQLGRAEKELEKLRLECCDISNELLRILGYLMTKKGCNGKWQTFRQALGTVWRERDINALEKKLDRIRSKLDTTLLMCLR
jgi:hypothetical protein